MFTMLRSKNLPISYSHSYKENERKKKCSNHFPDENALFAKMFQHLESKCEWIIVIDMDEFITFDMNDVSSFTSITKILKTTVDPLIRLPWWNMGSENKTETPTGLIVDSYHRGTLQPGHLKTIAKSNHIRTWEHSLFPFFKNGTDILSNQMTLKQYGEYGQLHDSEMFSFTSNHFSIQLPRSQIFLKHYMFLSWNEFVQQRSNGTRLSNSGNKENNIWAENPRDKWVGGYWTTNDNYNIGVKFTKHISNLTHIALKTYLGYESCHKLWGHV